MVVYSVYFLTNLNHIVIYTGMTNDLPQRVFDHKVKRNPGFTAKYNCSKLVYYEEFNNPVDAIHREKQVKRYSREWKHNLINKINPEWKDLSESWYDPKEFQQYIR